MLVSSAGSTGFPVASSTGSPHHIRPPSAAKINKALEELRRWNWEVKVDRIAGKLTASGPSIDHLVLVPLPRDNQMSLSRALLAQALVAIAELVPNAVIAAITKAAKVDHPQPERRYYAFRALKEHVESRVIAIAAHGSFTAGGQHLAGPQALLELVCRSRAGAAPAKLEAPYEAPPRSVVASAAPSKQALVKAWKYVKSNALGLRVTVSSEYPLKLELQSEGFRTRFEEIASATVKPRERDPDAVSAKALVLNALIDIVKQADIAGLRAWLPNIDADLIFDPASRGEVLLGYELTLYERVRAAIDQAGYLGLGALRQNPYLDDPAAIL